MNSQQIAVRCRSIAKEFGRGESRTQALRGIDLDVQLGQMSFLVGPSGCGKTTLLSVIAGLLERTDGELHVLGALGLSERSKALPSELSGGQQQRVAMADLFPRFSLTGSFGGRSDIIGDLTTGAGRFWGFGPSVRWPIFAGGRIRANIQAQNARQEQALALYEKAVLTSMEEVENALVAYAQEQERRLLLAKSVQANRRAADQANSRYTGGLEDFLSVLDALRSLYASQDQLAQSEQAVEVNVIGLYKALGGGWERPGDNQSTASRRDDQ